MSLTPVAEGLAVELSLPVLTNYVCPDRESKPDLPHARRTLYHCATASRNLAGMIMIGKLFAVSTVF